MKIKYLIIITLALVSTSCAAVGGSPPPIAPDEVVALQHGTAQWIIDAAKQGEYMTTIFTRESDNLIVYSRPFVDNVAFVIYKGGKAIDDLGQIGGNLVSCTTWDCFVTWMVANGFRPIGYGAKHYVEAVLQLGRTEIIPIFILAPVADPFEFAPDWLIPEDDDV